MRRFWLAGGFVLACVVGLADCAKAQEVKDCGAQTICGDLCVDLSNDTENCGACGASCSGTQACVSGKCADSCPGGSTICAGSGAQKVCVDTKSDNANCGACGKSCKSNEACVNGFCSTSCSGKTLCTPDGGAAYCTDPKSDNANCGVCGKACKSTEACVGGACVGSCTADQTVCAGDGGPAYCASVQSDNANCGACGVTCGLLEACVAGACTSACTPTQLRCTPDSGPAYCIDSLSDNANCGACGNVCPANKPICAGGTCTNNAKITALVCGAPSTAAWATDVQTKLMATNGFVKVDVIACNTTTPSLAQLQGYQSVLVFSDSAFANAATLGDNLADYVAGGGYAVVTTFANASVLLGGKWISQGYNLIAGGGQAQPAEAAALKIVDPMSPLVAGVSTLTATSGYKSSGGVVNGGVVVAQWGSGAPLIVSGVKNGKKRAELNFYPPSSAQRADFWVGDGATIMKNALVYR